MLGCTVVLFHSDLMCRVVEVRVVCELLSNDLTLLLGYDAVYRLGYDHELLQSRHIRNGIKKIDIDEGERTERTHLRECIYKTTL